MCLKCSMETGTAWIPFLFPLIFVCPFYFCFLLSSIYFWFWILRNCDMLVRIMGNMIKTPVVAVDVCHFKTHATGRKNKPYTYYLWHIQSVSRSGSKPDPDLRLPPVLLVHKYVHGIWLYYTNSGFTFRYIITIMTYDSSKV